LSKPPNDGYPAIIITPEIEFRTLGVVMQKWKSPLELRGFFVSTILQVSVSVYYQTTRQCQEIDISGIRLG